LRIGIDAMQLWGEWTGVGRSVWEVARRLAADGQGHEFVFYASRGFLRGDELVSERFHVRRTWFHARRRTLRILWQQMCLPFRATKDNVAVLHAPAYVMPVLSYVPTVVTVHDTIAFRYPAFVGRGSVAHLRRFLPKSLERAQLVTVPSRTVGRDLGELFGTPREKIRVIPFGVGPEFRPLDSDERARAREELGLARPYVLFVGRIEAKKNIQRVVEGFFAAALARRLPHDLVLAGPASRSRGLDRLISELGMAGRVRRTGYVPDEELPRLYAAADLVLLPSIVEGFGFPLLEAMASGTPCVISRDPALAELAAGAAARVPATRLDRLRETIEQLLAVPEEAARLRDLGLARAREFTWERTVELTLAAYAEARERYEGR